MNRQAQLWQDAKSGAGLLKSHVEALRDLMSALDLEAVEQVAKHLDQKCREGSIVFCTGNGGSAATASHLAADLSWGRRMGNEQRPRAMSLVANTPILTALANDVGYSDVFVEQMKGLFRSGDVVIAISASGNSENVLKAVDFANNHGGSSIGLVGFDGGKLKDASQLCVHVASPVGAYELVEDVHHSVCHMLANYLKYQAAQRASASGQNPA